MGDSQIIAKIMSTYIGFALLYKLFYYYFYFVIL